MINEKIYYALSVIFTAGLTYSMVGDYDIRFIIFCLFVLLKLNTVVYLLIMRIERK